MNRSLLSLFPPEAPPHGEIFLRGSKSLTNRALVAAALASSPSVLRNASNSDDCSRMITALEQLGVRFEHGDEGLGVYPLTDHELPKRPLQIDVGPAGTTTRFLTALCAVTPGVSAVISGTKRMHERPIGPLVEALRSLGATIEYLERDGCPPLRIEGSSLSGGRVEIPADTSSQFLTALFLVAARFREGLELVPVGTLVSRSYLEMTFQILSKFGVQVEERDGVFRVAPSQELTGSELLIEGDASGASYLWAGAALSGGDISVGPFPPDSKQGDLAFPRVLSEMGADVSRKGDQFIRVRGRGQLKGVDADMFLMPDAAQTLAVLAASAEGKTVLRGLRTLRVKETDRIAALEAELAKCGVATEVEDDVLTVFGAETVRPARIATYEDHRMAMSFAVLAFRYTGIEIEEPEVVIKSFPDFWDRLESLGVRCEPPPSSS